MNPYSAAWVLTALTGAALSLILLVESVLDLRALHGAGNGRRTRVWGRILQEFIRLTVHIPFAIIGVLALNSPVNPESTVSILILLYGNVAFILNSIIAMVVRRRADSMTVDEAEATIKEAAEIAAAKVLSTAAVAEDALEGDATAAQQTAENTRRTAENTERQAPDE